MSKTITRRAFLFGRQACKDEEGATAVEYGLIAALISISIIAGASLLGNNIASLFTKNKEVVRCTTRVLNDKRRGKACQNVGVY